MSEREQLREALAKALAGSHGPGTIIDAVLAVLDQQGWVSPEQHEELWGKFEKSVSPASHEAALALIRAERDAALREAARYKQAGIVDSRGWLPTTADGNDYRGPLYRRVTTGEEG